mmetsp:Transcript_104651/g.207856  ORF Transcript_104651/g.207856 Transcript_104651/m.207856 type:complete len:589 (+) Transcript_104651:81-1847(+)
MELAEKHQVDKRTYVINVLERERNALQVHLNGHFREVGFKLQQAFSNMTEQLLVQETMDSTVSQTRGAVNKEDQASCWADKLGRNRLPNGIGGPCTADTLDSPRSARSPTTENPDFERDDTWGRIYTDLKEELKLSRNHKHTRTSRWAHREINGLMGRHHNIDPKSLRGRVQKFLQGPFDAVICFLILLNVVATFVSLQELGNRANKSLGEKYFEWPNAALIFHIIETIFTSIFVMELVTRLFAYRCDFFTHFLNFLDLVVISVTAVDVLIITNFVRGDREGTDAEGKFLRLLALARSVRILRTMRYFKELRVILDTIVGSFTAVFWCILSMLMIQWMMAMLLCQALHGFVIDEDQDLAQRRWINRFYGSGTSSFYTLFEATFSGCWPTYFRPLTNISPVFGFLIGAYVLVVTFTMSRIVSALFLRETLRQASDQAEMMVKERKKETGAVTRKLHAIFLAADTSGDGLLTEDETTHILSHEKVRMLLSKLGLEANDGHVLFKMLDDGRGFINRDEFVAGIKHLKGEARSIDLVPLVQNCHRILQDCQALRAGQEDVLKQTSRHGRSCLATGFNGHCHEAWHQQQKTLI